MLTSVLVVIVIIILTVWLRSSPFYWYGKGIDWMIPWPLLGNTGGSLIKSYFDFWLKFYRDTKGPLVGFHMFGEPALLLKDPELCKQVMVSDADSYMSHAYYVADYDLMRPNIFAVEGEEWRTTRSKMTPYFSPAKIKSMVPIIESSIDTYVNQLEVQSKKGPVEISELSIKLSTDVIVSTAFGMEPDTFTNPDSFFSKLQKELPGFLFGLRLLVGVLSPSLYRALGLTVFPKATNEKATFLVDQVLEMRLKGEGVRPDFMQGMIDLYTKDKQAERKIKYNSDGTQVPVFNKLSITAQAMIMLFAGTDSTAYTLSFIFYELAMNTDVQDKLRNEIMKVFSPDHNGKISYDDIKEMVYMNMVIAEASRLYSIAPVMFRRCTRSTRLAGVEIPNRTFMAIAIAGMHRDPKFYPDPDKFDPERFAPGTTRKQGTYLPFGLGPRTCIGMRFAELEIKLTLCKVLSKFYVRACSQTPDVVITGYGPATGPRDGIRLLFVPIVADST